MPNLDKLRSNQPPAFIFWLTWGYSPYVTQFHIHPCEVLLILLPNFMRPIEVYQPATKPLNVTDPHPGSDASWWTSSKKYLIIVDQCRLCARDAHRNSDRARETPRILELKEFPNKGVYLCRKLILKIRCRKERRDLLTRLRSTIAFICSRLDIVDCQELFIEAQTYPENSVYLQILL